MTKKIMKLTRTRLLPIMLLVLFVVAMISSCMMLISCKDDDDTLYEGEFYTLQAAYDNGYLTYDDLKEVKKKQRLELEDKRLEKSIMNTYYLKYLKDKIRYDGTLMYPYATINDVRVDDYYGTFHGCEIVRLSARYFDYPGISLEYVIEDIVISYSPPEIVVWRKIK